MKKNLPNKVSIFISVDQQVINTYFNAHDPAPLYKRQLSHQFESYLMKSAAEVKKHSVVFYKLKCSRDIDRQFAEPLLYALRRHFSMQRELRKEEFNKFKKQNFYLLLLSFLVVVFCHGVMPMFLNSEDHFQVILLTSLDIFSWVILWRPIDKLIFDWSAHLKDISLLNKLASAEMMIVNTSKEASKKDKPILFALSQTG